MSLTLAPPRTEVLPKNIIRLRPPASQVTAPASVPSPPSPPSLAELVAAGSPMRVKMSREQWLDYPFEGKSEWVDGEAVLMLPARHDHSYAQGGLQAELSVAFPGLRASPEYWVSTSRGTRVPDVALVPRGTGKAERDVRPLLVAEILSRSSARQDREAKAAEYLNAGIGQYWIVDPVAETVEVLRNDGGVRWQRIAVVDSRHPEAAIEVAGHGTAVIRHSEIFE